MAFRPPLLLLAPVVIALIACAAPTDTAGDEATASALTISVPIDDMPVLAQASALDHSFTIPARWSSSYTVGGGGFGDLTLMGDINGDGKKDIVQFALDGT